MTATVHIVDYGAGNLFSIARALEKANARPVLMTHPEQAALAERLILPGVGAFGRAMETLAASGMDQALRDFASTGRPFLGICLGMQMMLETSAEFGAHRGLGLIAGRVEEIPRTDVLGHAHKVPHVGWGSITPPAPGRWTDTLLVETAPGTEFYFVHSFEALPAHEAHRLAVVDYNGRSLTAAIRRENLTGFQFHPEKSGPAGLLVLAGFLGQ